VSLMRPLSEVIMGASGVASSDSLRLNVISTSSPEAGGLVGRVMSPLSEWSSRGGLITHPMSKGNLQADW
jgi:hypothetical protein